jgi:hypothetical protein
MPGHCLRRALPFALQCRLHPALIVGRSQLLSVARKRASFLSRILVDFARFDPLRRSSGRTFPSASSRNASRLEKYSRLCEAFRVAAFELRHNVEAFGLPRPESPCVLHETLNLAEAPGVFRKPSRSAMTSFQRGCSWKGSFLSASAWSLQLHRFRASVQLRPASLLPRLQQRTMLLPPVPPS